jgi:hypothetical protein
MREWGIQGLVFKYHEFKHDDILYKCYTCIFNEYKNALYEILIYIYNGLYEENCCGYYMVLDIISFLL